MKWLSLTLSCIAFGCGIGSLIYALKKKSQDCENCCISRDDYIEEFNDYHHAGFLEGYENAESLRMENLHAVYQKLSPLKRKIFHQVIQNLENGKAISPDILDDIHEFDDLMEAIVIIACCYDKRQKYKNKHVE